MRTLGSIMTAIVLLLAMHAGPALAAAEAWVCPPCSHSEDDKVYDKPGACPVCGMALMRKDEMKNVAILVFDGVQIIDYTGPYEVFGQVNGLDVFTVSETGKTITTAMGMSVNPKYSFETAPAPDIIVVPGGNAREAYDNPKVIAWLKEKSEKATNVLSVCNGAFIIAKAGLLDGKKATTFYGLIDELREFAPKVEVVTDQRFVDNGKVITSAGLSSGIDASLHLVSKLRGEANAKHLALHLEYDWHHDTDFARAALADLRLPSIPPPPGSAAKLVTTDGDRDHWEKRWQVVTEMSQAELRSYVSGKITELEGWSAGGSATEGGAASQGHGARDAWVHTDTDGSRWIAISDIQPDGDGSFLVRFYVERAAEGRASTR